MKSLTSEEFKTLISSKGVVQFSAPWCGPCRALSPVMERLSDHFKDNLVLFGKLDIDSFPDIAAKYGIRAVPTIICFNDNSEVDRIMGMKTEVALKSFIEDSLNV